MACCLHFLLTNWFLVNPLLIYHKVITRHIPGNKKPAIWQVLSLWVKYLDLSNDAKVPP